ncbi:MAG: hypothetical protein IT392_06795 [Nitrospirae bacterium]|nr:hypothetical protein [Nitrospirota bacterium]
MKIAYFDYWTVGIDNFVTIDSELRKRGHETMLLHVGSFNAANLKEEVINGIICRDISFYGTKMIYKMFEREKPDIIITLNTTQILDRVLTMSCRKLKIKSIYLMHGIRDLGSSNDQLVVLMEQSYNSLMKKIKKTRKYISTVIPNYLFTLSRYNPIQIINFRCLKVIYSYFKNPGKAFRFPEYCDEIVNDKCLVYSTNDIKHYKKLGYNSKNITVVGNPKYDKLHDLIINDKFVIGMLPETVRKWVKAGQKYAVLLEESFPEQNNMGGYTADIRDRFIMDCAERLKKENIKLVVKLHPVTEEKAIRARHDNIIIEKNYLDALIYFSEFCICSLSTTINNCVLMNKPVLMPRWSVANNLPTFFVDVGVSNCWNNCDDGLNLTIDKDAREKYIKNYITIVSPGAVNNILQAIGVG